MEANANELISAGLFRRFLAFLTDVVIFGCLIKVILFGISLSPLGSDYYQAKALIYIIGGIIAVYWFCLSVFTRKQATFGQGNQKLFVTDKYGNKLTIGKTILRFTVLLLTILFSSWVIMQGAEHLESEINRIVLAGSVVILVYIFPYYYTKRKQLIHDMISQTFVMKKG